MAAICSRVSEAMMAVERPAMAPELIAAMSPVDRRSKLAELITASWSDESAPIWLEESALI